MKRTSQAILASEGLSTTERLIFGARRPDLIDRTDSPTSFLKDIEGASAIRYQIYELLDMATWPL